MNAFMHARGDAAAGDTLDNTENTLEFDVYRTIVLGHYVRHWGMPEFRRVVLKSTGQTHFEVYSFPSRNPMRPFRIASIGLANEIKADGKREGKEYYMALAADSSGTTLEEVFHYFASIVVHIVEDVGRSSSPRVLEPSVFAPANWAAKALLIDEARAENDGFDTVCIAHKFDLEIEWLIPLRDSESMFILDNGIDAFDDLVQSSEQSLIDPNREGLAS